SLAACPALLVALIRTLFSLFLFSLQGSPTPEIYTLPLHDALPISAAPSRLRRVSPARAAGQGLPPGPPGRPRPYSRRPWGEALADRKSTRLNSSHVKNSYAVFCSKKKRPCGPAYACGDPQTGLTEY